MIQNGTPPLNFEPHEWAMIVLLKNVRDKFLKEKLDNWKQRVEKDDNLRRNVAIAFLNLQHMLHYDKKAAEALEGYAPILEHVRKAPNDINQEIKDTITSLLDIEKGQGHLLFNSYCYTAVEAFGEMSLTPIVPGHALGDSYSCVLEYFYDNKLPFRINPQYISAYTSLILPCNGGITPQFFDQVYRNEGDITNETLHIPYFLGDLRILFKLEDFLQGHFSMIASILHSDSLNKPLGVYVLTSVIPDAFKEDERKEIVSIAQDIAHLQILSSIESKSFRSPDWIRILPIESKLRHSLDKRQIDTFIKKGIEEFFLKSRDMLFAAKVQFQISSGSAQELTTFGSDNISSVVLNFDSIYRLLKSIFPSGPWLDRGLVCDDEVPYNPINIDKLTMLCKSLIGIVDKNVAPISLEKDKFVFIRELFSSLLPELWKIKDEPTKFYNALVNCLQVMNMHGGYKLLFIKDPDKQIEYEHLKSFRTLVEKSLKPPQMPDGDNRDFADLKKEWIRNQNENLDPSKSVSSSSSKDETASKQLMTELNSIFKDTSIRAIMILKERQTYIPDRADLLLCQDDFRSFYLSYPCFWFFERINHIFSDEILDVESFSDDNLKHGLSFGFHQMTEEIEEHPKVEIYFGEKYGESERKKIIRSLIFLGMPISKWEENPECTDGYKIVVQDQPFKAYVDQNMEGAKSNINHELIMAYRCYVTQLLLNAKKMKSLQQIRERSGWQIESITLHNEKECILHEITLNGGTVLHIKWVPERNFQLEFCCIKDEIVMNAWKINLDNIDFEEDSKILPRSNGSKGDREYHGSQIKYCFDPVVPKVGLTNFRDGISHQDILDRQNEDAKEHIYKIAREIRDLIDTIEHQKAQQAVETEKKSQHAWAHSMGNDLNLIQSIADKSIHYLANAKVHGEVSSECCTDYNEVLVSLLKLYVVSRRAFNNNQALFRKDSESAIFSGNDRKYSLEDIYYYSLLMTVYNILSNRDMERYKVTLKRIVNIDSMEEAELARNIEDTEKKLENAQRAFEEFEEYYDELEIVRLQNELKLFTNKQKDFQTINENVYEPFIKDNLRIVEGLLFEPYVKELSDRVYISDLLEKRGLIDILSEEQKIKLIELLSNDQDYATFKIRWFDEFDVNIDKDLWSDSDDASSCVGRLFQEIMTNVFKYTSATMEGRRVFSLKVTDNAEFREIISENSCQKSMQTDNLDGHYGRFLIEQLITLLLATSKNKVHEVQKIEHGHVEGNIYRIHYRCFKNNFK